MTANPWESIRALGGDAEASREILERLNSGSFRSEWPRVTEIPQIDGHTIVDVTQDDPAASRKGWESLPRTVLGILNGGSATSYIDRKKNLGIHPLLAEVYREEIEKWGEVLAGRPKALAPAFYQPDGTPGASFLELKVRWAILAGRALGGEPLPLLQMTSPATHQEVMDAWQGLPQSPWLRDLVDSPEHLPALYTARQELISAFTPADSQGRYAVFFHGEPPRPLLLPGGHGQNFQVLAPLYRRLAEQGREWVYLTNVDNLGALPSARGLGTVALKGAEAGFDFSFKTELDVKGGILFRDDSGRLQCGDLGVAVDPSELNRFTDRPILFNCATGVFHLPALLQRLPEILARLPLRLSVQDKDVGRYAQVEQVTWEVIGLLERPLILAVQKKRRFLAAKMIVDTFLTSALKLDDPLFHSEELAGFADLARQLNEGLTDLLQGPYGLKQVGGYWEPLSPEEVEARIHAEGRDWISPF